MGPIISHLVSFVYLVLTEQMFCGILLIGSDRWGSRCLLFFPGFNSLNRDRNSRRAALGGFFFAGLPLVGVGH